MVPLTYQWYHWLTNGTNYTIGRANGTIGITIGTNGFMVNSQNYAKRCCGQLNALLPEATRPRAIVH